MTGRPGPFLPEHIVAQLLMQPSQCPVCPMVGDSEKQDDTVVHKPSEDVLIHVFFWKDAQDWFVAEQVKLL